MKIINIAAYKFVTLSQESLLSLQKTMKAEACKLELLGTILLSTEGINLMLAGLETNISGFKKFLAEHAAFSDLIYKESISENIPFKALRVRIRKELITMKCDDIQPEKYTGPHLAPEIFKQWYEEKRDMVVLDTRNHFEIEIGAFDQAMDLNLTSFSEFPKAVENLPEDFKEKTIVMYCTGGIRCEKASALMLKKGFKHVYQLDGGILHYFKQCGDAHYHGECFVFDDRVTIGPVYNSTMLDGKR
jgi:UPF0176 protein